MNRTLHITFNAEQRIERDELIDLARDVAQFMVEQLDGVTSADLVVVGVRGRGGERRHEEHVTIPKPRRAPKEPSS